MSFIKYQSEYFIAIIKRLVLKMNFSDFFLLLVIIGWGPLYSYNCVINKIEFLPHFTIMLSL